MKNILIDTSVFDKITSNYETELNKLKENYDSVCENSVNNYYNELHKIKIEYESILNKIKTEDIININNLENQNKIYNDEKLNLDIIYDPIKEKLISEKENKIKNDIIKLDNSLEIKLNSTKKELSNELLNSKKDIENNNETRLKNKEKNISNLEKRKTDISILNQTKINELTDELSKNIKSLENEYNHQISINKNEYNKQVKIITDKFDKETQKLNDEKNTLMVLSTEIRNSFNLRIQTEKNKITDPVLKENIINLNTLIMENQTSYSKINEALNERISYNNIEISNNDKTIQSSLDKLNNNNNKIKTFENEINLLKDMPNYHIFEEKNKELDIEKLKLYEELANNKILEIKQNTIIMEDELINLNNENDFFNRIKNSEATETEKNNYIKKSTASVESLYTEKINLLNNDNNKMKDNLKNDFNKTVLNYNNKLTDYKAQENKKLAEMSTINEKLKNKFAIRESINTEILNLEKMIKNIDEKINSYDKNKRASELIQDDLDNYESIINLENDKLIKEKELQNRKISDEIDELTIKHKSIETLTKQKSLQLEESKHIESDINIINNKLKNNNITVQLSENQQDKSNKISDIISTNQTKIIKNDETLKKFENNKNDLLKLLNNNTNQELLMVLLNSINDIDNNIKKLTDSNKILKDNLNNEVNKIESMYKELEKSLILDFNSIDKRLKDDLVKKNSLLEENIILLQETDKKLKDIENKSYLSDIEKLKNQNTNNNNNFDDKISNNENKIQIFKNGLIQDKLKDVEKEFEYMKVTEHKNLKSAIVDNNNKINQQNREIDILNNNLVNIGKDLENINISSTKVKNLLESSISTYDSVSNDNNLVYKNNLKDLEDKIVQEKMFIDATFKNKIINIDSSINDIKNDINDKNKLIESNNLLINNLNKNNTDYLENNYNKETHVIQDYINNKIKDIGEEFIDLDKKIDTINNNIKSSNNENINLINLIKDSKDTNIKLKLELNKYLESLEKIESDYNINKEKYKNDLIKLNNTLMNSGGDDYIQLEKELNDEYEKTIEQLNIENINNQLLEIEKNKKQSIDGIDINKIEHLTNKFDLDKKEATRIINNQIDNITNDLNEEIIQINQELLNLKNTTEIKFDNQENEQVIINKYTDIEDSIIKTYNKTKKNINNIINIEYKFKLDKVNKEYNEVLSKYRTTTTDNLDKYKINCEEKQCKIKEEEVKLIKELDESVDVKKQLAYIEYLEKIDKLTLKFNEDLNFVNE